MKAVIAASNSGWGLLCIVKLQISRRFVSSITDNLLTQQSAAGLGRGGGGDAEEGHDLLGHHVPDQVQDHAHGDGGHHGADPLLSLDLPELHGVSVEDNLNIVVSEALRLSTSNQQKSFVIENLESTIIFRCNLQYFYLKLTEQETFWNVIENVPSQPLYSV